jgi:GT2 family glycosyltransferase
VTVCIVNWNCRKLLRRCLLSLDPRRQRLALQVVVVDNGSSDGAADMVAADFPEVVLIRNAGNEGFAHANNQAAAVARGRFLFFLNNDTVVPAGALRRLHAFARANPDVGIVGPRLRDKRGRTQLSFRLKPTVAALLHHVLLLRWTRLFRAAYRSYRSRGGDCESTRAVEVLMGAALFMRRDLFRAVGGWDERFTFGGEDIDLCDRVAKTHSVVYHPAVAITHYGRASSRKHNSYAYSHTLVGITRCLRSQGTRPSLLLAYKSAVTLDAPLQLCKHLSMAVWQRLRGRHDQAVRSRRTAQAVGYFVRRGLVAFWKA